MKKVKDIVANPSGWDSLANYMGDLPEDCWLSLMTRNRDADTLTESNWAVALEKLGGESEDVQIFRFGHWACGWWEALAVRQGSPSEAIAQVMHDEIEDYPVLNEGHFSELEQVEAERVWADCYNEKERLEYIREHRSQFEFHDFKDLRANVKGRYFSGYASELLG